MNKESTDEVKSLMLKLIHDLQTWNAELKAKNVSKIVDEVEPASDADNGKEATDEKAVRVAVVMGSTSDWETMRAAAETLAEFQVGYETRVVSAHRTPELMREFAREAEGRGLLIIIAGAGGAAHLPGMLAAQTTLPVLGVPVESRVLRGMDSLLSIVQMPSGVPVATFAIGTAGAVNAALFAVAMLANTDADLRGKLKEFRARQEAKVMAAELPAVTSDVVAPPSST